MVHSFSSSQSNEPAAAIDCPINDQDHKFTPLCQKSVRFSPDTNFHDEDEKRKLQPQGEQQTSNIGRPVVRLWMGMVQRMFPFPHLWNSMRGSSSREKRHRKQVQDPVKPIEQVHSDMLECLQLVAKTTSWMTLSHRRTLLRRFESVWQLHYRELALFLLHNQFNPSCTGKLLIKPLVEEIMFATTPITTMPDRLANYPVRNDHEKLRLLLRLTA